MARPLSDGLPYIGLPTDWFRIPEHKILRAKLGDKAVLIWSELYLSCFERNGYYKTLAEDDVALLADEYHTTENFIGQVMHFLAQRSLVDATLLRSDKVVTSRDIQLVFQEAVKTRGKTRDIEVREGYWLLSKKETKPFIKLCPADDFFGKNGGYFGKNGDFPHPKHNKEKKRKVKKSKEKIRLTRDAVLRKKQAQKLKGKYVGRSISRRGELIRREYERICGDVLPRQDAVTAQQLDLIRQGTLMGLRMKDYRAVFAAVGESGFLKGSGGKWRATFGWLITPEKAKKVLTGAYRDYCAPKKEEASSSSFDTDEFFEAALRKSFEEMEKYNKDYTQPSS